MATKAAFEAFVRNIGVAVKGQTETAAKRMLVQTAISERERVMREQSSRAGVKPTYEQIVDGRRDAPLPSVKPDGYIIFEWSYLREIAKQAIEALRAQGPELEGDWKESIGCFADDVECEPAAIPEKARVVEVLPGIIYARFLEEVENFSALGFDLVSSTAAHLASEWRQVAKVRFTYITLESDYAAAVTARARGEKASAMRYPTIRITPI